MSTVRTWLRALAPVALLITLSGCGGQPWNNEDPPPGFYIRFVLDPGPAAPANIVGAQLNGAYIIDLVDQNFLPVGNTFNFNNFFAFGRWTFNDNKRWPARWRITSVSGCGAGTSGDFDVRRKGIDVHCSPQVGPVLVTPPNFPRSSPPGFLTLGFDGGVAPAGTAVYIYIVDPDTATVLSSESATILSDGTVQISTPSGLADGEYYVIAEFNGPAYQGAQGAFTVWTDGGGGGGGGGNACDSPDTHNHWGSCGGADECGHVFGSDTDCGCPNAPIVYDTCYQTVCDYQDIWVDEYCEGTTTVCDWYENCYWYTPDGAQWWWQCDWYPYNCREEPYSYVCGGHWETQVTNCREEPYECNPHQCGF